MDTSKELFEDKSEEGRVICCPCWERKGGRRRRRRPLEHKGELVSAVHKFRLLEGKGAKSESDPSCVKSICKFLCRCKIEDWRFHTQPFNQDPMRFIGGFSISDKISPAMARFYRGSGAHEAGSGQSPVDEHGRDEYGDVYGRDEIAEYLCCDESEGPSDEYGRDEIAEWHRDVFLEDDKDVPTLVARLVKDESDNVSEEGDEDDDEECAEIVEIVSDLAKGAAKRFLNRQKKLKRKRNLRLFRSLARGTFSNPVFSEFQTPGGIRKRDVQHDCERSKCSRRAWSFWRRAGSSARSQEGKKKEVHWCDEAQGPRHPARQAEEDPSGEAFRGEDEGKDQGAGGRGRMEDSEEEEEGPGKDGQQGEGEAQANRQESQRGGLHSPSHRGQAACDLPGQRGAAGGEHPQPDPAHDGRARDADWVEDRGHQDPEDHRRCGGDEGGHHQGSQQGAPEARARDAGVKSKCNAVNMKILKSLEEEFGKLIVKGFMFTTTNINDFIAEIMASKPKKFSAKDKEVIFDKISDLTAEQVFTKEQREAAKKGEVVSADVSIRFHEQLHESDTDASSVISETGPEPEKIVFIAPPDMSMKDIPLVNRKKGLGKTAPKSIRGYSKKTVSITNLKRDGVVQLARAGKPQKWACPLCSFSSSLKKTLTEHSKICHRGKHVVPGTNKTRVCVAGELTGKLKPEYLVDEKNKVKGVHDEIGKLLPMGFFKSKNKDDSPGAPAAPASTPVSGAVPKGGVMSKKSSESLASALESVLTSSDMMTSSEVVRMDGASRQSQEMTQSPPEVMTQMTPTDSKQSQDQGIQPGTKTPIKIRIGGVVRSPPGSPPGPRQEETDTVKAKRKVGSRYPAEDSILTQEKKKDRVASPESDGLSDLSNLSQSENLLAPAQSTLRSLDNILPCPSIRVNRKMSFGSDDLNDITVVESVPVLEVMSNTEKSLTEEEKQELAKEDMETVLREKLTLKIKELERQLEIAESRNDEITEENMRLSDFKSGMKDAIRDRDMIIEKLQNREEVPEEVLSQVGIHTMYVKTETVQCQTAVSGVMMDEKEEEVTKNFKNLETKYNRDKEIIEQLWEKVRELKKELDDAEKRHSAVLKHRDELMKRMDEQGGIVMSMATSVKMLETVNSQQAHRIKELTAQVPCTKPGCEDSACEFAHGKRDEKLKPKRICSHFLRGSCHWGDRCRFQHQETKHPIDQVREKVDKIEQSGEVMVVGEGAEANDDAGEDLEERMMDTGERPESRESVELEERVVQISGEGKKESNDEKEKDERRSGRNKDKEKDKKKEKERKGEKSKNEDDEVFVDNRRKKRDESGSRSAKSDRSRGPSPSPGRYSSSNRWRQGKGLSRTAWMMGSRPRSRGRDKRSRSKEDRRSSQSERRTRSPYRKRTFRSKSRSKSRPRQNEGDFIPSAEEVKRWMVEEAKRRFDSAEIDVRKSGNDLNFSRRGGREVDWRTNHRQMAQDIRSDHRWAGNDRGSRDPPSSGPSQYRGRQDELKDRALFMKDERRTNTIHARAVNEAAAGRMFQEVRKVLMDNAREKRRRR